MLARHYSSVLSFSLLRIAALSVLKFRLALRHLTLLTIALACAILLCTSPALAQKYYEASVGGATHHIHDVELTSGCGSPTNMFTVDYDQFDSAVAMNGLNTLAVLPQPFVKAQNGRWIPVGYSYTGPNPIIQNDQNFTTSGLQLSADGIVRITFNLYSLSLVGNGTVSNDEIETINLNNGTYARHYTVDGQSSCGSIGGVGLSHLTRDDIAILPIALVPFNGSGFLGITNPSASSVLFGSLPGPIALKDVPNALGATSLASDGQSAVALVFTTRDAKDSVTFTIAAPSGVTAPFGSLSQFDPNYLTSPSIPTGNAPVIVNPKSLPGSFCDSDGTCYFVALLWAPASVPVSAADLAAGTFHTVPLNVTATQLGVPYFGTVNLQPPPLLLVHGVWSSAAQAWPNFQKWLATSYPGVPVSTDDYGALSEKAFNDPAIQSTFIDSMSNALATAAARGLATRSIDVVAHSMGGLVTRFALLDQSALPGSVHKLITIGTPYQGSPFPQLLEDTNVKKLPAITGSWAYGLCAVYSISPCTLPNVFGAQNKVVDGAVEAMVPNSPALMALAALPASSIPYGEIIGEKPIISSTTEDWLNRLVGSFLPGQTNESILGTSDTIVPQASQAGPANNTATVFSIVHTAVCPFDNKLGSLLNCSDIGETSSSDVWCQSLYWLMGGQGPIPAGQMQYCNLSAIPASSAVQAQARSQAQTTSNAPVLDLTGYTQVPASDVTFAPATNTALTINSPVSITANSSTKTIIEVLLFQIATDPTDYPLYDSIQAPFTIGFTPTRMGSADFVAFALFSDMTYATTALHYTLQPIGSPIGLNLVDPPLASLPVGSSALVSAQALFSNGPVDVTQLATYQARSGTSSVFSVGPGGTITATGAGVDSLDVSYNGVTASAPIFAGSCTYALSPVNQVVSFNGGSASIQVTAPSGCAWTAAGGDTWLALNSASGTGSGLVTVTATPNTTGSTQTAIVTVADQNVAIIQPATACTYAVSQTQINAPAVGASGTLTITTACPIVASSNADWVVPVSLSGSVNYSIAPNTGSSPRTATMTVGTQVVGITQTGQVPLTGTTTALVSSLNPSDLGFSVTLTVTVTPASGTTTPTGTVTFFDGTTSLGTDPLNASGVATLSTSAFAVGSHSITASYAGDTNFSGSTSNVVAEVVLTPSVATMVSSLNPSVAGQSVTFTVTVTGAGGTPTGNVRFLDGTTLLGRGTLDSTGVTTLSTSTLAVGSHLIHGAYVGDTNFSGAGSTVVTQVVNNSNTVATTAVLQSSLNPSVSGQSVTFTVTVTGAGGTPTGTVTFFDGTTSLGTGALNVGKATLSTSALSVGSHSITGSYGGDSSFSVSTSNVVTEVVNNKVATTSALQSSQNPSTAGQSVTFTATVAGTGGTPTGTVTFSDGTTSLGTGALNVGKATLSISALSVGSHSITGSYGGDSSFSVSTSTAVTQVVNGKPTATVLTSSLNPSIGGQSVTFTATVTSPAGGTPTGMVTFSAGTATLGTGTLNASGVATLATSAPAVGSDSITATYSGDANYAASTSSAVTQTVSIAGFAPVSTAQTVTAGQSAVINLTAYAASGSNLTFTLGCIGLPSKTSCSFNSNSVAPGPPPNGTAVQLTLLTASSELPANPANRGPWPWGAFGISVAFAALFMAGIVQLRRVPRRCLAFGMGFAVFALAAVLVGCGSSGGSASSSPGPTYTGTPKGTATFTVMGTSGTTTISTPVSVTVQ